MKNIAIIAEYNPLHNGHLYQMRQLNRDIIVALSGNFTERGDVAVLNKYTRARQAVEHGASMVVEIPTFGVTSCAEHYARCASCVLSKITSIDALSFGSEYGDIEILKDIANIEESDEVKASLSDMMRSGISYPSALAKALSMHSDIEDIDDILSKPNNILGIEYIRAMKDTAITPTTIKRMGEYNNTSLGDIYASASSIRANINSEDVSKYLPRDVLDKVRANSINNDAIYHGLYQKLLVDNEDISDILGIGEGLDNRIREALAVSNNYDSLINNIKTKRYTMSRIKRTLINILLSNSKDMADNIDSIDYVTVLAIRRDRLNLLSNIDANVVTKYNDYANTSHPFAGLDIRANKLYNLLSTDKISSHQMQIID